MNENKKIDLDGNRPATLHYGAVSTDFPTLLEAIMAWHRLRPEQAQRASIRIIGGELYAAAQIPKLLNGSKPSRGRSDGGGAGYPKSALWREIRRPAS